MIFDPKNYDLGTESNQTITDIFGLLEAYSEACTAARAADRTEVDSKYVQAYYAFLDTLSPEQKELNQLYEEGESIADELHAKRSFILGFKTGLRLAIESLR